MSRWVTVRFEGSGFHMWADAPDEYKYLRQLHHHVFRVTCRIEVMHPLRSIEFIDVAANLRKWFQSALDIDADFLSMSCETMAERVAGRVADVCGPEHAVAVEVTEDGIHGGGYARPATTS